MVKKHLLPESTTIATYIAIDFNNYDYDILGEAYEEIC